MLSKYGKCGSSTVFATLDLIASMEWAGRFRQPLTPSGLQLTFGFERQLVTGLNAIICEFNY